MLELKVPGTVAACVTDNAAVMGKARETLEANEETRERWGHVSHGGCLLHWLDLLFEDVVKITFFAGVVETARAISKYFRSHTRPADLLRKHQKLQYNGKTFEPALPGETRMGTNYIVLQFVVKSWSALQAAVTDPDWEQKEGSPRAHILNDKTHDLLLTVKDFLKPVWTAIRLADTDGAAFTPYVYPTMLNMKTHMEEFNTTPRTTKRPERVPEPARKKAVTDLKTRWEELHHPIYSMAWQLNPATTTPTSWQDIDKEAKEDVKRLLCSFSNTPADEARATIQLSEFRNRTGNFVEAVKWDKVAWEKGPLVWWESFGSGATELFQVAERVFSFVPVASASERNWSCFGFIHSKLRARLYNDKTEKLVFLYQKYPLLRARENPNYKEPVMFVNFEDGEEPRE